MIYFYVSLIALILIIDVEFNDQDVLLICLVTWGLGEKERLFGLPKSIGSLACSKEHNYIIRFYINDSY